MGIWKWFNTLFRFMSENISYTPHDFNLTFLKIRLEFWTKCFHAIYFNIQAYMREVSSKSEMVICRDDPTAIKHLNFTKTVGIWKWFNTLFRFMSENISYTPHDFNLTFLKIRLEFWTKCFHAIFFNIQAYMREVSSRSEMVICRDDPTAITHLNLTSLIYKASYIC